MTPNTKAILRELAEQDIANNVFRTEDAVERMFGEGVFPKFRSICMEIMHRRVFQEGKEQFSPDVVIQ